MDEKKQTLSLNESEAQMLLAMASENAAKGPNAKTLASLYEKALALTELFKGK